MSMDETDPPPSPDEKTSVLLRRVFASLTGETVRIQVVLRKLRRRSFGGMFILLAALGLIPGIAVFAGLAILIPATQLMLGFRAPLLPRFISNREVGVDTAKAAGARLADWIERLEVVVRPRWPALTGPPAPMIVGALAFCLALVILIPLPFSNLPPAVALFCLSLALLERDGLMLVIGLVFTVAALAIGVTVAWIAVESLTLFLEHYVAGGR